MAALSIIKHVLSNGLAILILPNHQVPKVSVQLWYNVGSKHELSGERGIAHLIEHMIFKGTEKLSESDINLITHKLSGVCNAFTSHDYTGYLFDLPSQHWYEALPIMADCMRNCTFKEHFLQSEMKAVIQELKMYNDDYQSTLIEKMISAIFSDHPYHFPIIGYKQDLWNLQRDALVSFYQKHYIPNNATLVVVGDVQPEDVIRRAEEQFGSLTPNLDYKHEELYHAFDIGQQQVSIYRDVQQKQCMVAWVVPGVREQKEYQLDLLSWILGAGQGSRLYQKIVHELELATELESFVYDLFDHGLFFIHFQPAENINPQQIIDLINKEIQDIVESGISDAELQRAVRKTHMDVISLRENNQKMAYLLGKYYTALGDENYILNYQNEPKETLAPAIRELAKRYLRPTVMHSGVVNPLPEQEKEYWSVIQKESDAADQRILSQIQREEEVEEGSHVAHVTAAAPTAFAFPRAQKFTLENKSTVISYNNPITPKIDITIDLKAKHFYDPAGKEGLGVFLADMLQEGTQRLNSRDFSLELEHYGMSLDTFPGQISITMLAEDFEKGLQLLQEVLTQAAFDEECVEKVRARLLADVKNYWDTPSQFISQLARTEIFGAHPYSKTVYGTPESLAAITRKDLFDAYKKYISPHGSKIAVVGDISGYNLEQILEQTLGQWQGPVVEDVAFPELQLAEERTITHAMNRDQIVIAFAGTSLNRYHEDYDKLLLFDQVFTGGVLGSMSSRLFELRERSGLFYTIGGSLLAGANKQPGMQYIKTIVSPDRLEEAERAIKQVIAKGATDLTEDEHEEAQRALINSLVDNFSSNRQIAASLLFLENYDFAPDYFDNRAQRFLNITKEQVQEAVTRHLKLDNLITLRVGRL